MTASKSVYIALGSNKGNKLEHLQLAIDAIFERVGTIRKISKVYETPALGFEGDDFYNACIKIETELKPKKLLKTLHLKNMQVFSVWHLADDIPQSRVSVDLENGRQRR